jgi:stage II sporulation protein D
MSLLIVPLYAAITVKVETGGKVQDLTLEQYVTAVVAGESSVFQSSEALKAMAIAARTYAVRFRGRHGKEGYDFCETTHCQRIDISPASPRVEEAVANTAGELLWFQGKPAFTPYARDCGGRTEAAAAIWADLAASYLISKPDPYCARAGGPTWQWRGDPAAMAEALRKSGLHAPNRVERVTIVERTASGRVRTLMLTGAGESVRISEGPFRLAIGRGLGWNTIRGDTYEVTGVAFTGKGSGHGVGLCQRGADEMGREGRSYREILAFYYPGTAVGLTAAGLSWQLLKDDRVSLWTVQPNQDKTVLASAERSLRHLESQTRWPSPRGISVRVYPDLDTYRNATGEPGTVAAYTQGHRIYMQPVRMLESRGILDSTVAHELAHVLIGSQAKGELPVWFQEGLANYLAGLKSPVGALVGRYGEATVLAWVRLGLPREVTNASASQPAMKSR